MPTLFAGKQQPFRTKWNAILGNADVEEHTEREDRYEQQDDEEKKRRDEFDRVSSAIKKLERTGGNEDVRDGQHDTMYRIASNSSKCTWRAFRNPARQSRCCSCGMVCTVVVIACDTYAHLTTGLIEHLLCVAVKCQLQPICKTLRWQVTSDARRWLRDNKDAEVRRS